MNALEQHDELYRQAYRKYLADDLEVARSLATEAVEKARLYSFRPNLERGDTRFFCRAMTLLNMIERRSLLVKEQ